MADSPFPTLEQLSQELERARHEPLSATPALHRAVSRLEGMLRSVLDSSTEYSLIAKDMEGRILIWNEGARRMFGYTAEEMEGHGFQVLVPPEEVGRGDVKAFHQQVCEQGHAERVTERVRKDGSRFTASVVMTRLKGEGGRQVGYLVVVRDLTEQLRIEQLARRAHELEQENRAIQEASRFKDEFLANMSHELRTPLNSIIGFTALLAAGKAGSLTPRQEEFMRDILTSARHLLAIINEVLDLAKIDAGGMELRPAPVELAAVVAEARALTADEAARKRLRVEVEVDPTLGQVEVDPTRLRQVLYNYLSNALKFTEPGGRIVLRACAEGEDFFRLEVEDTGIGIAAGDMPRLFKAFQQLDAGMGKRYQGTGLGLAVTRRIVEAQGGSVGVRSEPGRGSVFHALLPRRAASRGAEPGPRLRPLPRLAAEEPFIR